MKTNVWRAAVPVLLLACLFGSVRTCYGQTGEAKSGWKKKWIIAALALTAANIFDAYSSRGGHELNPLLRGVDGKFSPRRAILVKSAASGGGLLLQAILIKKMPDTEAPLRCSFAIEVIWFRPPSVSAHPSSRSDCSHPWFVVSGLDCHTDSESTGTEVLSRN